MESNGYLPLVKRLASDQGKVELVLDLTEKSATYIARCALKQDYSGARSILETSLKKVSELKDVDTDKFAECLIKYLFDNRKR